MTYVCENSIQTYRAQWYKICLIVRRQRFKYYPRNRRSWPTAGLMLVHRLRRWTTINPTMGQLLLFGGYSLSPSLLGEGGEGWIYVIEPVLCNIRYPATFTCVPDIALSMCRSLCISVPCCFLVFVMVLISPLIGWLAFVKKFHGTFFYTIDDAALLTMLTVVSCSSTLFVGLPRSLIRFSRQLLTRRYRYSTVLQIVQWTLVCSAEI